MPRTARTIRRPDSAPTTPTRKRRRSSSCVHHWLIAAPVEMISRGRCSRCGAERDFSNRFVEPDRGAVSQRFARREPSRS